MEFAEHSKLLCKKTILLRGDLLMKISKISFILKNAPLPAIMTIISFVLFVVVYWFMTATAIEPHFFLWLFKKQQL